MIDEKQDGHHYLLVEIYGSNVLLLGVGDIGTEFLKVLKVLTGANVTGVKKLL